MALPYPTKVVLPFDIATAQDMNERHANDVALAAGTGLDDGSVAASKIDFATFANGGQLVLKTASISIPSGDLSTWGNTFYKDVTVTGGWSGGNFSTLLGAFAYTTNAQYTVNGPVGTSISSPGNVRLVKATNPHIPATVYVVGIGTV